jgi:hypothetical protein
MHASLSELWISRIGRGRSGVCVLHMIIGRTECCRGEWTVGKQSNRTKKFIEWGAQWLVPHSRHYYGYHTIDSETGGTENMQWRIVMVLLVPINQEHWDHTVLTTVPFK